MKENVFIELDEFPQFTEASVKIRIHRCTWQSRWKGHCKTWKDACSCSVHARIFSTKTAMTTSEEDDDGLFCSKNDASYWHAIFTKTVAKHLSSYSPGLTATPLYTFYDLLLKRNYRFFSRFASNNNSDYLHFPALFFVALIWVLPCCTDVKSIEIRQMFKNIVAKIGRRERENPHNHIKINTTVKSRE